VSGDDVATETHAEAMRCPSAEELRMVCAIARLALREAAHHGEYRAIFRGFAVQALRQRTATQSDPFVEVHLCVSLGRAIIERVVFAMAAEGVTEPRSYARVM
jgi:hypothetical protein